MAPRFISGMICGVGILLLRTTFQIYLALSVRMMLPLRLTWDGVDHSSNPCLSNKNDDDNNKWIITIFYM